MSRWKRCRNVGAAVVEALDSRRLLSAANPCWTNVYTSADYSVGPGPIAFYANHQNNPALANATVRFIVSADSVVGNGDDIVLASSPYATSAGPVAATLPDLAPGTYHFFATCNNTNPVSAGELTVGTHTTDGPDLTPAPENPLFGLPTSFPAGELHAFNFDIINRGSETVSGVSASLYLSPTPGLSSGAYLVQRRSMLGVEKINPRSLGSVGFYANFPSPMPAGVYYPVIVIDPDNQIAEADETNNVFVGDPVTITPPTVDISLVSISTEPTATINPYYWTDPIPMDVTFRSTGTGANLRLFLSLSLDDIAGNADDILVGYTGYFNAPPGDASSGLTTVRTTASYAFYGQATPIVAGTYHLVASTDAPPDVTPADNTILGPEITLQDSPTPLFPHVWSPPPMPVMPPVVAEPIGECGCGLPETGDADTDPSGAGTAAPLMTFRSDLTATLSAGRSVAAPGATGRGAALTLRNSGGTAVARKYNVTLYLSKDRTWSADDVAFSTRAIKASIAAGRAETVNLRYTLPKSTRLGTQYLIAVADVPGAAAKPLTEKSGGGTAAGTRTSARVVAAAKVTVAGSPLTAVVRSVKAGPREGTSLVTVRVTNGGNAAFSSVATLKLLTDSESPEAVLSVKKALNLKGGKHVDITLTVRRPVSAGVRVVVS